MNRHGWEQRKTIRIGTWTLLAVLALAPRAGWADDNRELSLRLRSRVETEKGSGVYRVIEKPETWKTGETAIIVCDMWDLHHCKNAVLRGTEMAPRMDRVLKTARAQGAIIIHAPSSCMDAYKDHPARKHASDTARSKALPKEIALWCKSIPSEEKGTYPIDQSDGGEDDDLKEHEEWAAKLTAMGRNPRAPWKSQTNLLTIADSDYISDNGEEIWSILEERGIKNVVLLGVHLNMCVLGRPFGLRQMAKNGKHVVLMRDMTDTMYNPKRAPYVSHFAGTDLMIEHVEKFVAPSITSDQLLGDTPFRFKDDARPHVAFVIAEDEYKTEVTLPIFASTQLTKDYLLSYILGDEGNLNELPGMKILDTAEVAVVSVRRRILPKEQLDAMRRFVAAGKSVVGLRTASHAFAPRAKGALPSGHDAWEQFDAEVLGGNYHGHYGDGPAVMVTLAKDPETTSLLKGVQTSELVGHGSLYKVSPLATSATPLLLGSIPEHDAEPIAWTNVPASKNRVFYTSLGQIEDFKIPAFNRLLRNAIDWAARRESVGERAATNDLPIQKTR